MLTSAAVALFLSTRRHLRPLSRRTYHYELARFARAFGERPLASLTLNELEDWLATLPSGHAHNVASRLRTAYRFWHRRLPGAVACLSPQAAHRRLGHAAWTEADVAAFRAHWPPGCRQRHIFEAALRCGLRRSDLARVLWAPASVSASGAKTQKTGAPIHIWPDPALDYGAPMSALSLGHAFRLWSRAAGIGKPLHGLRKLAAQRAAEAGCTGPELCALFGWASLRIAEVYVRASPRLAASALAKLASTK